MTAPLNWFPAWREAWLPIAGLAPLVAVFASRGAAMLATIVLATWLAGNWREARRALTGSAIRSPGVVALVAFTSWGALSTAWSLAPDASLAKSGSLLLIGLATTALATAASRTPVEARLIAVDWLATSTAATSCILLAAGLSGRTSLRFLHPDGPWDDNWINRPATTLVVFATVAVAGLAASDRPRRAAALALLAAAAAVLSTSQSAALAALLAMAAFGLCTRFGSKASVVFLVLLCASPFVFPLLEFGWPRSSLAGFDLPRSFAHRVEIWNFATGLAFEHALFGIGLDAYRNVSALTDVKALWSLHPHNLFMQVWVELGAVGLVLAVLALGLALPATVRGRPWLVRFAISTLAAALTIGSFAWGAWQGWWLSTMALAVLHLVALPEPFETAEKESPRRLAGARVVTGRIDDRSVE